MTTYRLKAPDPTPPHPPTLDDDQRRVVDHPGGPLLVLAGPGTGKTTTLVEAIVERIEHRGADPASVLALTFSRKAAEQLRDRVTARLGRTLSTNLASTFHSFAYGLVRRYSPADLYAAPLRLLSAPDQDVLIQELLTGEGALEWPDTLSGAVRTRGFAAEVQAVLSRARERGLDPVDLVALGEQDPAYAVAGRFMQRYLVILDDTSTVDYADLVRRAVQVAEQHREEIRARYGCVFVDEYQDSDPSQVELLQALAGDGRDLVVVGDPDQSIYGFRGADVAGILHFPTAFPTTGGEPAPVVALRTTRRFGPRLLVASQRVASGIGVRGDIGREAWEAFRSPVAVADDPGRAEVLSFDTARAEVEQLADLLRRAHLEDDVPWSQMAVLVRSGRASLPALRRSLTAGGVPVEVAADDTPLVREPAVMPLLAALAVVVDAEVEEPTDPRFVGADRVEELLVSPLGRLDATDVRGLARALRAEELARAAAAGTVPRSSRELLRRVLTEPGLVAGLTGPGVRGAQRLAGLLERARRSLGRGESVEEVLWTLWAGTDWGDRLRAATQGSGAAARYAHRDLDALCALFETAARAEEQRGHTSVRAFLETLTAQEIPADTLAERGVRGDSVRLLTAHRAKGLEWQLVVVAHVQEQAWPDLRRRGSLLNPDRLGRDGLLPAVSTAAMLAEERRLFYVACTRARSRLVVTAVASPDDDGEQPSRFLEELGRGVEHRVGRPVRPLSMPGLVAELRRVLGDPDRPEPLRRAAATRLARLATLEVGGRPVAPQADPASWWGMRDPTSSERPLRDPAVPITVSASMLQAVLECPAQWFLEREAGGARVSTASQGFGTVVHALADRLATGDLTPEDDLMALVDEVWPQMEFRTPWSRQRERQAVEAALVRFLHWQAGSDRELLGTEVLLDAEVTLPGSEVVRLRGYADRLELDADGRVVVVDLKTGKYPPTDKSVLQGNPQLSLYQLAVEHGAADEAAGTATSSGGAELVHLRTGVGDGTLPKVQPAPADEAPLQRVREQLAELVGTVRGERLVARPETTRCGRCDFQPICPAHVSGSVLS